MIVRRYKKLSAVKREHIIELLAMNDAWENIRIENDNHSKRIGTVTLIRKLNYRYETVKVKKFYLVYQLEQGQIPQPRCGFHLYQMNL